MSDLQDYELKDQILRYLLKKRAADPEHMPIASSTISAEALPNISEQITYFLINKIISNSDPLVEFHARDIDISGEYWVALKATAVTESFIYQGGYTRAFEKQSAKEVQATADAELERKVRIDTLRINKNNKYFMKINILFLIINTLIAGLALYFSLKK